MTAEKKLNLKWIDPYALRIVDLLQKKGFETYLVGGCVRDLLAGIKPKDFDIATGARPEQVRRVIPQCYIIGRRFRLALAKRGLDQFEIATFRRNGSDPENEEDNGDDLADIKAESPNIEANPVVSTGLEDNFFGTSEEDSKRRDFTVNGLFFDPGKDKIIDHVHGLQDVEDHIIRMIGDPLERLIEDPIRTLRGVRLAHKLKFRLDPKLREAILSTRLHLKKSVLPRRREEFLKLLRLQHPERAYMELYDLGVLEVIAPSLHEHFKNQEACHIFFECLGRMHIGKFDLTSSVELFAAFVYSFVRSRSESNGESVLNLLEDKITTELMRNELGVFKMESTIIIRTIQLLEQLANKDTYLRKGSRRQRAMVLNDTMPLAIKMGQLDYTLVGSHLLFWMREQERHNSNKPN